MGTNGMRDSFGALVGELVDSFPLDVQGRTSISDFGKMLFNDGGAATTLQSTMPTLPTMSTLPQPPPSSSLSTTSSSLLEKFSVSNDMSYLGSKRNRADGGSSIKGVPRQKTPTYDKEVTIKRKATPQRWTSAEDDSLRVAVKSYGERNWKAIAEQVTGRNHTQCLQRWTKVLAPGLVKGHWRPEEDELLRQLVAEGRKNWGQVATRIPGRTSKQCRERWYNHLDPNIVRGEYSTEEDRIILDAQLKLGNKWSSISAMLPGRTEDAVKIRWKSLCRTKAGKARTEQVARKPSSLARQSPSPSELNSYARPYTPASVSGNSTQSYTSFQQQQSILQASRDAHINQLLGQGYSPTNHPQTMAGYARPHQPSYAPQYAAQSYAYEPQQYSAQQQSSYQQHQPYAAPQPSSSYVAPSASRPRSMNPAAAFARNLTTPTAASPMYRGSYAASTYENQQRPSAPMVSMPMTTLSSAPPSFTPSTASEPVNPTIKEEKTTQPTPRESIDIAARASAARRQNRFSESGRNSIEGFLQDLGEVGRISDLDLGDLTSVDPIWRMSDDMNRLSL